ncbi:MAG: cytochrome c oxidase subunit 3 family protein [Bryobacterales bacterium]|nr:cytochrome c oxidase subunit 3 family protein [Bryobacterales bacterium]
MSTPHATAESRAHAPFLQHHFHEASQQAEAAKIGMWLFLITEILLFGGLFVGYGILRMLHTEAFHYGHTHLDRWLGAMNTVVLLVSSFTMAMAVHSARVGARSRLIRFLMATLALAAVFLGIKYVEYSHKFHEGLLPGRFYRHPGDPVPNVHIFFSLYFVMTGLHGLHVVAGMIAIGWVLRRALRGDFSASYYSPVDLAGLYWHLVDMIWIYLFPLLYLVS